MNPYNREPFPGVVRNRHVRLDKGQESRRCNIGGFGGTGRGHKPKNVGSFWELKSAKLKVLS